MKKILAIAIAAGMAAPAIADTTLYGQLHASIDVLDGDNASVKETTISSNSSRIGVKGSSELSGGLKTIYQAEWEIDTGGQNTTGDTIFKNRNQVVGIAGSFGAVLLGRHDTPFKIVGRKADLFWSSQLGQNRNITSPGRWDIRANNAIAYQSPKIGGVQVLYGHFTDIGGDDGNTGDSINAIYKAGPLMVGVAYETYDTDAAINFGRERDAYRLMGSYKFGAAKVVGFYQDEDNDEAVLDNDASVWGIGGSYKITPAGTVKAQYYERDEDNSNLDGKLFAIGYDHKLGKKTDVYAQYAKTEDLNGIGGAGHGEKIGSDGVGGAGDASGISIGIRHKF